MTRSFREELLQRFPNLKDFVPYLEELNTESPRGKVLVSTGYLEQMLEEILRAFMLKSKRWMICSKVAIYIGVFAISRASIAIFENPLKAYVAISMIYFSFAATLTGAFGEIDRLNNLRVGSPVRVLQFEDMRYDEKEWQIIAFATEYVIVRNRQSKQLLVRSRKELKSIETS
jgi:hypothetical protein